MHAPIDNERGPVQVLKMAEMGSEQTACGHACCSDMPACTYTKPKPTLLKPKRQLRISKMEMRESNLSKMKGYLSRVALSGFLSSFMLFKSAFFPLETTSSQQSVVRVHMCMLPVRMEYASWLQIVARSHQNCTLLAFMTAAFECHNTCHHTCQKR